MESSNPIVRNAMAAMLNSECRAKDPSKCATHGDAREHGDKGHQDRYGNGDPKVLAKDPKKNIDRGKAVITRLIARKTGREDKAMFRKDIGWVGVDYGMPGNPNNGYAGGFGLVHIIAKHNGAEKSLPETLQKGKAYKHPYERRKIVLIHGDSAAILAKERNGRLLITDFENLSPAQAVRYKSSGEYHAKGEN